MLRGRGQRVCKLYVSCRILRTGTPIYLNQSQILWKQPDLDTFVVSIRTDGILPLKSSKHDAKNGTADVTILKEGMNVLVEVKDAKKRKKTIYTFEVVRFPSPINRADSHWKVEKDQIVISLKKKEPIDWMPFVFKKGLDQSSSSSSSEDEDLAGYAAAPKPKGDRVLRLDDISAGVKQLVIIERKAKKSDSTDDN